MSVLQGHILSKSVYSTFNLSIINCQLHTFTHEFSPNLVKGQDSKSEWWKTPFSLLETNVLRCGFKQPHIGSVGGSSLIAMLHRAPQQCTILQQCASLLAVICFLWGEHWEKWLYLQHLQKATPLSFGFMLDLLPVSVIHLCHLWVGWCCVVLCGAR